MIGGYRMTTPKESYLIQTYAVIYSVYGVVHTTNGSENLLEKDGKYPLTLQGPCHR